MSPAEGFIVVVMTLYAVYRQTRRTELRGSRRFTVALVYALVAVAVGGLALPDSWLQAAFTAVSIALSVLVGFARGRLTRVWEQDGRYFSQGTPLTIGLFAALVLAKVGLGFWAAALGSREDAGFAEVLLVIAVMIAVQAELVYRRAVRLGMPVRGAQATTTSTAPPPSSESSPAERP